MVLPFPQVASPYRAAAACLEKVRNSGKRLEKLERKGEMNKIYRSTKLVISAAFFIVFVGSVDTTYAQGNFDQFVSVPNNLPALTVAPENPLEGDGGITLDLSGGHFSRCQCNCLGLNGSSPGRNGEETEGRPDCGKADNCN